MKIDASLQDLVLLIGAQQWEIVSLRAKLEALTPPPLDPDPA